MQNKKRLSGTTPPPVQSHIDLTNKISYWQNYLNQLTKYFYGSEPIVENPKWGKENPKRTAVSKFNPECIHEEVIKVHQLINKMRAELLDGHTPDYTIGG